MNTHTPGPWHISALDGRTCGPSRLLVCDGAEVPQLQAVAIVTQRTGETDANARLIAAAPDLLAALESAVETIRTWHSDDSGDVAWNIYRAYAPEMQTIDAALAKATGTDGDT